MVRIISLFIILLFASAALAAPPSSRLATRLRRRREGRQAHFMHATDRTTKASSGSTNGTYHTSTQYSTNWAGALFDTYPSDSFNSVTGTFTVPTPQAASGETEGAAAAWVGIDGNTCTTAILQTGVDFTVINGVVSYDAWYEWYPDLSYDFEDISISAGDSVTITVTATSTTAGTAEIINQTTGQTVSKSLTSSYPLCEQNAEWIVEDYVENTSLVPFANFGAVTFTGASAGLVAGGTVEPSTADTISLEEDGTEITSVLIAANSVTITYTGS
ncbi:hypothetical protein FRB94_010923 [Tulasnella sp. JGI-2019a]|nr:hypothetical protein FRB93_003742 [Tulasnella sp. JGI-2019a]KAG8993269.1 hypothetical protein FRB94_010923 [Tulasnella sp. JGI-2019a]